MRDDDAAHLRPAQRPQHGLDDVVGVVEGHGRRVELGDFLHLEVERALRESVVHRFDEFLARDGGDHGTLAVMGARDGATGRENDDVVDRGLLGGTVLWFR